MYRKEIEGFIDSTGRNDMIFRLCRINSEKMPYVEGKVLREGLFQALQAALAWQRAMVSIRNRHYVGTADSMTVRDSWISWPTWTWFGPVRDG